jgi:hypothetical protein
MLITCVVFQSKSVGQQGEKAIARVRIVAVIPIRLYMRLPKKISLLALRENSNNSSLYLRVR